MLARQLKTLPSWTKPVGLGALAFGAVAITFISLRAWARPALPAERPPLAVPTLPAALPTPTAAQWRAAHQRYLAALEVLEADYARLLVALPRGGPRPGAESHAVTAQAAADGAQERWQAAKRAFLDRQGDDLLRASVDVFESQIYLPLPQQQALTEAQARIHSAVERFIGVVDRWADGSASGSDLAEAKLAADEAFHAAKQTVAAIPVPAAGDLTVVAGASATRASLYAMPTMPSFGSSVTPTPRLQPTPPPTAASAPSLGAKPAAKIRATLRCSAGGPPISDGKRAPAGVGSIATCQVVLPPEERQQRAAATLMLGSKFGIVGPVVPDQEGAAVFRVPLNQPGLAVLRVLAADGTPLDANPVAFDVK